MKKLLLLLLLFIVTGCSSNVEYDFKENFIDSNIEVSFNNDDYVTKMKTVTNEFNDVTNNEEIYSAIEESINNVFPTAYTDADGNTFFYKKTDFENDDYNYNINYDFTFNYETFKSNYYLNECFDFYTLNEDSNYYYFNVTGDYTCDFNNIKLKIKADNVIYNANSDDKEKGAYIWNIKESDNNIYFALSKNTKDKGILSTGTTIFGIVLLVIIGGIIFFVKRKSNE